MTNHAHVLIYVHLHPNATQREIAQAVGITERAVQMILDDLEQYEVVYRERIGRRNHYRVRTERSLRHPIEAHCSVADLLAMVDTRDTDS
ncbi:MAG: hypothetical protein Kow0020_05900 [Wenzhouxiangellaceae bacterium]